MDSIICVGIAILTGTIEAAIKMKMAPPRDKVMEEGKFKLCKVVVDREE